MTQSIEKVAFGLLSARRLSEATGDEWLVVYEELPRSRALSTAVHQMNRLLDVPEHRELAMSALKRIGLEHAG